MAMSVIHDESPEPDRSLRLISLGVLCFLLGLISLGVAAIILIPVLVDRSANSANTISSAWMGALFYSSFGAALIWIGTGSIRRQRWVPPLMKSLAWTWLISGVAALLLTELLLEDLLAIAADQIGQDVDQVGKIARLFVLLLVGGVGIVLPAILAWGYHGKAVLDTVQYHDPRPGWTDRCSPALLPLVIGWVLLALISVPLLTRPVVPWFGVYLGVGAGRLVSILGILLALVLAVLCFRRRVSGWWGSLVVLFGLGVSTLWTVWVQPLEQLYRAMGYPESVISLLATAPGTTGWLAGITIVLTLAGMFYVGKLRREFGWPDSQT